MKAACASQPDWSSSGHTGSHCEPERWNTTRNIAMIGSYPSTWSVGSKIATSMNKSAVVHVDPEIMSGTPVFVGTRVPFRALIDYLEGGHSLDEFLDAFPTVSREQAVTALEEADQAIAERARPA